MAYPLNKIKNICLLGHGGDGKTSLSESILFMTKQIDRLGKITDGTTTLDYDPEEIRRKYSVSASMAPVEFEGFKINLIDTPGYFDFAGEVMQALRVADAGVIVVTAKSGIAVGTEKAWKYLTARKMPRIFYVSKLDEENARFYNVLESLRKTFGVSVCPVVVPILDGEKTVGIADVITRKGYKAEGGKLLEIPIPESMKDNVEEYRDMVKENAAESSDELMEKFFGDEEFTDEEMYSGIHAGVLNGTMAPVFCGSAFTGLGTLSLLRGIAQFAPSPNEMPEATAEKPNGETVKLKYSEDGSTVLFVFKTVADQYGRFSYFKVMSGKVTSDMSLINSRTGEAEKMGHIYIVKGKKNTELSEITCGDIGAVAKLGNTKTGDTLCASGSILSLSGMDFAKPCYAQAISPKVKGNEEKIMSGLNRLKDEDPSFTTELNTETKQMTVAGAGDIHLDVLCSKLKNKFGVDVELSQPRVPYREKIRKKVTQIDGKHKKQSGGHGQYGHVKMDFEPIAEEDFVFEEKIFGGSVPKNFHPAVEKGIRESMQRGMLAGYPMVGLKATLVDGSYHDVDSNELSFKMAAKIAYKAGIPLASPVILEPVGHLKVFVPDNYMGDVIGDLNKRRGRVLGMTPTDDGLQMVEADVPMAEINSYSIDLRSMTQGRGSFDFQFERYEEAPGNVQQKIIEEAKAIATDEEE